MNHFPTMALLLPVLAAATALPAHAQQKSNTWNPNISSTQYRNPIIDADYSDPDVIRVGTDYYMTASSFCDFPGLPILHSTDLVNWELIGHALAGDDYDVLPEYRGTELDWRCRVQHGNYVWAPALRYHDGWFYIYCGDPDQGIFMVRTQDPAGTWEPMVWVKQGKGLIDPCPLWDDDGRAYLSHGCAGSRAGVKSVLFVAPMSADGTHVVGPSRIVYDGHETQPTIEGTKFYKRNGYYYIMSPAGGVPTGWQVELRSRSPFGPYEEYVSLAQGASKTNGPHQGGWVDTQNGEDWFIHFQDKGPYGRVTHLQPARWVDDWLVIGNDKDGDGCGDAVERWTKPNLPSSGDFQPVEDDEFTAQTLGLQWQWSGPWSHYWYYCDAAHGRLRLYAPQNPEGWKNLGDNPNLLLQKTPTNDFTATAKVKFAPNILGENAGLVMMGQDYAALKIVWNKEGFRLQQVTCKDALSGKPERVAAEVELPSVKAEEPYTVRYAKTLKPSARTTTPDLYLRVKVHSEGSELDLQCKVEFYYSLDGKKFQRLGEQFTAKEGKWIGTKLGFFCCRPDAKNDGAWLDVDWIRFTKK